MGITIKKDKIFLVTENTEYIIGIKAEKYLSHLYYGPKNPEESCYLKPHLTSFSPYSPSIEDEKYSPTDAFSEYPFFGTGDFGTCALRVRNESGVSATEFFFEKAAIVIKGGYDISPLPFARITHDSEILRLTLRDSVYGLKLHLYYIVFPKYDIIIRYATLLNEGEKNIQIEKISSATLDLRGENFSLITLCGDINDERHIERFPLRHGRSVVESRRGSSSHRENPFIAVCKNDCKEESGEVYGFNFIYSGSFCNEVEYSADQKIRVNIGLGEENFTWLLEPGEKFTAPEALITYSDAGLGKMSRNMHNFIRDCILPDNPLEKRPIVLNSWEGCHFDINEDIMLSFADECRKYGYELLVIDDGWFGKRTDDSRALGDWQENRERFPEGLSVFAEKVKSRGIKFGIWIEPEMISPNSNLYKVHPEYALHIEGRENFLSRSQYVLNFTDDKIVERIYSALSHTFRDVDIDYIKWDFNRNLSHVSAPNLPPERQGECWFRYTLGMYKLIRKLRSRFPNVFFETCSGGGGRYDLGMMCFGNQIWTSDNTLPTVRTYIQYGSLLAYPAATMSCHVSDPHGDTDELKYRFDVAAQGMPGYEFNAPKLPEKIKSEIPAQIAYFNKINETVEKGDLYRVMSPFEDGKSLIYYVSKDNSSVFISAVITENATDPSIDTRVKLDFIDRSFRRYPDDTPVSEEEAENGISVQLNGKNKSESIYLYKE